MANEQKQQYPIIPIVTPWGRLVAGSISESSDIGHGGKKRDEPQFYFAVAVNKQQPGVNELLGAIYNHTLNSYSFNPNIQALIRANPLPGPYVPEPQRRPFAWKIQDGDWPSNAQKEGWAGCWVFGFTASIKVPFTVVDSNNQQFDPRGLALGKYVTVSGSTKINGLQDANCGIYLNPQYVRIEADGPVIVTGPTPQQAFAGVQVQRPAGMPAFVAGAGQQQQAAPPVQQPQYAPPAQQPQYAPPAQQPYATNGAPQQPAYAPPPAAQYAQQQPAYAPPVQQHQAAQAPGYAPQQQYAPQGNGHVGAQAAPAYAPPAPPAPPTYQPGSQGTAYPSNGTYQQGQPIAYPAPGQPSQYAQPPQGAQPVQQQAQPGWPPVQPHPSFVQGQ